MNEKESRADATIAFEQYKLLVEMADKVSERRATANNFYLTLNTALVSATFVLKSQFGQFAAIALCVFGILLALIWRESIKTYKKLNGAKFRVILEIEKSLPAQAFADEWQTLKEGKNPHFYRPLSDVESLVPAIFAIAQFAMIIFFVFGGKK